MAGRHPPFRASVLKEGLAEFLSIIADAGKQVYCQVTRYQKPITRILAGKIGSDLVETGQSRAF
jgi:hypothetical protein